MFHIETHCRQSLWLGRPMKIYTRIYPTRFRLSSRWRPGFWSTYKNGKPNSVRSLTLPCTRDWSPTRNGQRVKQSFQNNKNLTLTACSPVIYFQFPIETPDDFLTKRRKIKSRFGKYIESHRNIHVIPPSGSNLSERIFFL